MEEASERSSQEYATLEVAKERDRLYYNSCVETEKLQLPGDWDLLRLEESVTRTPLVAPTPVLAAPAPLLATAQAAATEFYTDAFHPVQQYSYAPSHSLYHATTENTLYQHTYHQVPLAHPYPTYSPYTDPKLQTIRSASVGGNKFLQRSAHHLLKRELAPLAKERKRPGPKAKLKAEEECSEVKEPEYDPELIANAHLTMEDDHYKCSVCLMKFKQPGNARRHIITVHRSGRREE